MTMLVQLTVEQLRALMREELRNALDELAQPKGPDEPITDNEMAEARKRFAKKVAGAR